MLLSKLFGLGGVGSTFWFHSEGADLSFRGGPPEPRKVVCAIGKSSLEGVDTPEELCAPVNKLDFCAQQPTAGICTVVAERVGVRSGCPHALRPSCAVVGRVLCGWSLPFPGAFLLLVLIL